MQREYRKVKKIADGDYAKAFLVEDPNGNEYVMKAYNKIKLKKDYVLTKCMER